MSQAAVSISLYLKLATLNILTVFSLQLLTALFLFVDDSTWPTIATKFCNGSRQSPINIISASAQLDTNLTAFTLNNFNGNSLKSITNTGKTVKVTLNSGISISGGGLSGAYDSLQFHLHWGNGSSVPGSEHTVNGKRYPMELHIVNSKAIYAGNTTLAVSDSTGLAALGFLIEVRKDAFQFFEMSGNATGQPASWNILSSYLSKIKNIGDSSEVSQISLTDLIPGVDTTRYYRYLGSLTTPSCNEAVVWTVFKDTVKVSKDVVSFGDSAQMFERCFVYLTGLISCFQIDKFSKMIYVTNSTSPLIVNNFRNLQPALSVTTIALLCTCNITVTP
uniref:Carbonic anhydrase n=1 Tax=Cyclopterus lumpus TaxID=8103 RepID=A0A8C2WL34_CYCLU